PLQRLDEDRAAPREVAAPAAWAEIAVEGDLDALLAEHLEEREEAAEPGVGIERKRDAGEIDEPRLGEALGDAAPVRQLEQLARRRFPAPVMAAARAAGLAVDHREAGEPAAHAQHEIARHPFGGGEREDRIGIGIVPERGRE